jgi:hypothetical protein
MAAAYHGGDEMNDGQIVRYEGSPGSLAVEALDGSPGRMLELARTRNGDRTGEKNMPHQFSIAVALGKEGYPPFES